METTTLIWFTRAEVHLTWWKKKNCMSLRAGLVAF